MSAKKTPAKRKSKRREKVDPETKRFQELVANVPFQGPMKMRAGRSSSWWSLPATGTYMGGNKAGSAAAHAFLKFLRDTDKHDCGSTLQIIALDMLAGRKQNPALRGQAVGFFSILDWYLRQAVRLDRLLEFTSYDTCRREIDRGLAYTDADDKADCKRLHEESRRRSG